MRTVIACISPWLGNDGTGLYVPRSYNTFWLPARKPNQLYTKLVIEDQIDYKKIVVDLVTPAEYIEFPVPGELVAKDILQSWNLEEEGGFICAGDEPSEAELKRAHERRRKWLVDSVQRGDAIFGKMGPKGLDQIPDFMKRATIELDITRDWVFQPDKPKVQCEGCGTIVHLLANGSLPAVCSTCFAILDEEKARRLNPRSSLEEVPIRKKPGRKPKVHAEEATTSQA